MVMVATRTAAAGRATGTARRHATRGAPSRAGTAGRHIGLAQRHGPGDGCRRDARCSQGARRRRRYRRGRSGDDPPGSYPVGATAAGGPGHDPGADRRQWQREHGRARAGLWCRSSRRRVLPSPHSRSPPRSSVVAPGRCWPRLATCERPKRLIRHIMAIVGPLRLI